MRQLKISQKLTAIDDDSFKQYLKDVSMIPIFTPEEELACAKKAHEGDQDAIDELVRRNLRFVISVAKQYSTDGIPLNDLVNEGNIGLVLAANKFEPAKGFKFISFAVWWIRKVIMEHININGRMVRIPSNKINNLAKVEKKINEIEQKTGREVSIHEVKGEFGNEMSDNEFIFLDLISKYNVDSLDRPFGDIEGGVLSDVIPDTSLKPTDHLVNSCDIKQEVITAINSLTDRDKKIMTMLYGLENGHCMTLEEVGQEIGLTREMIRQIKIKCLKKFEKNPRIRVAFESLE